MIDDKPSIGKVIANIINNDLKALLKKHKLSIEECPVSPDDLAAIARFMRVGLLDKKQVKQMLEKRFEYYGNKDKE